MITSRLHIAGCCIASFAILALGGAQQSGKAPGKVPYTKVEPLIKAKCISCHNPERHPGAVDLSSYKATIKSGDKGPIVIAGHPEKSKLIQYVDGTKQPVMPFRGKPLSKAEISLLKSWIAAGAKS